jgi:hypothetical protein
MERRRTPRRVPGAAEPIARLRVRTAGALDILNVSDGGALVEGAGRLLPGTHIDVHVITPEGRVLVRSRVVRASVSHVAPDAVRYRSGLMFDRLLDTAPCGYFVPVGLGEEPGETGTGYPREPPRAEVGPEMLGIREG